MAYRTLSLYTEDKKKHDLTNIEYINHHHFCMLTDITENLFWKDNNIPSETMKDTETKCLAERYVLHSVCTYKHCFRLKFVMFCIFFLISKNNGLSFFTDNYLKSWVFVLVQTLAISS